MRHRPPQALARKRARLPDNRPGPDAQDFCGAKRRMNELCSSRPLGILTGSWTRSSHFPSSLLWPRPLLKVVRLVMSFSSNWTGSRNGLPPYRPNWPLPASTRAIPPSPLPAPSPPPKKSKTTPATPAANARDNQVSRLYAEFRRRECKGYAFALKRAACHSGHRLPVTAADCAGSRCRSRPSIVSRYPCWLWHKPCCLCSALQF